MTMTERKVIKAKVGLLELAKQLGSVTQACRVMGYSRIGQNPIPHRSVPARRGFVHPRLSYAFGGRNSSGEPTVCFQHVQPKTPGSYGRCGAARRESSKQDEGSLRLLFALSIRAMFHRAGG